MSVRLVLDASAAIHVVMRTPQAAQLATLLAGSATVVAPTLYCSECANTLGKYVAHAELPKPLALERLEEALSLVDHLEADQGLASEALAAAAAVNHPAYDLFYLVLARRYGATLATRDKRLEKAGRSLGIEVVYPE
ncbi:type II toxin-antitoxin system VapC family toxin [Endothiovibrio diazotrophicus]